MTATEALPAPPAASGVAMISIDLIDPSPLNRTCSDDDKSLLALAASISEIGLQSPIAVRPKGVRYEIIYGERRFRACRSLGEKEICCFVKDVDDKQAHIERITENLQRHDLTPMEESNGVKALLEIHDNDFSEVAGRLGYTESWVRRRARLINLIQEWRDELANPETPYRVFRESVEKQEEIAILPSETQKNILDQGILKYSKTTAELRRELAKYFLDLDSKPWSREWEKRFVSSRKRCDACAKRSDREATLFADLDDAAGDGKRKRCLDPTCWNERVIAYCKYLLETTAAAVPICEDREPLSRRESLAFEYMAEVYDARDYELAKNGVTLDEDHYFAKGVYITGSRRGTIVDIVLEKERDPAPLDKELLERREHKQKVVDQRTRLINELDIRIENHVETWLENFHGNSIEMHVLQRWAAWYGVKGVEGETDFASMDPIRHLWQETSASMANDLKRYAIFIIDNEEDDIEDSLAFSTLLADTGISLDDVITSAQNAVGFIADSSASVG